LVDEWLLWEPERPFDADARSFAGFDENVCARKGIGGEFYPRLVKMETRDGPTPVKA
jgi:hypothetical protein